MAGRFSVKGVFEVVDGLTRPVARMEGAVRSFLRATETHAMSAVRGLRSVSNYTDKIIARTADLTKPLAIAGGVALTAGVAKVISAGADFEEAITAVGAVSLMTRDEIKDLEKQALELGSTTKFTATQVAQGMELMGRAGFDNNQILAAMPGLLSAAAAEGGELAETVGVVSNTLKGMGLEAGETQRVADVLTLASARTNSSITSLGESLKNAAPIARQFKIPLEEVTSAVALLQDVGIDASEAGTATATMLTLLAKPSKEAAAQMKALGLNFQDAHGNMLPLKNIFGQFADASKKAGGNMKAAAFFADLVGMRGQRAALNLKDAFASGKFDELTKELERAAGSAEKMATLRMQNLKGDWEILTGSIDGVSQAVFALQSGSMRDVVKETGAWIDKNKGLIVTGVDRFVKDTTVAIREAIPVAREFFGGLRDGGTQVKGVLVAMKPPAEFVIGAFGDIFGDDTNTKARSLGQTLVWVGFGLAGISTATRLVVVAQVGYRAAMVTGTFLTWAFTGSAAKSAQALTTQAGAATAAANATAGGLTTLKTAGTFMLRFALMTGLAVAAYKSWSSALEQNDELKKTTGGISWWDAMKMHPKELRDEVNKRMDAEAKAKNPANAAAWQAKFHGAPAAPPSADVKAAVKQAGLEGLDTQGSLTAILGDVSRQLDMGNQPNLGGDELKQLEQTLAAVKTALPTASFGDAANATGELARLTDTLKALQAELPDGLAQVPPTGVLTPGVPGAPAATPGAAPGVQGAAVQVVLPTDQAADQAAIIAAAVERAIKQGMAQAEINVNVDGSSGGTSPSGRASTSGTGIRQPRSGAM
jgi:TP901 family phage tail tape measure protein